MIFINNYNKNHIQFDKKSNKGHYESYFLRANSPNKVEAFWIRYTIFKPIDKNQKSLFEVWAIYFNKDKHVLTKKEFPLNKANLSKNKLEIEIENNYLDECKLIGSISELDKKIEWKLDYKNNEAPLYLLPKSFYTLPFPKAKVLVGKPMAKFNGYLKLNKKEIIIKNWIGSQNHNWGEKHTDNYAWGQVMGFDNFSNSFLEVSTARIKIANHYSPFMTLLVLKHRNRIYKFNTPAYIILAKGKFNNFNWKFSVKSLNIKIEGIIKSPKENFAKLTYFNPSGGNKTCQNSKIAQCELKITHRNGKIELLYSQNRTAFEILS